MKLHLSARKAIVKNNLNVILVHGLKLEPFQQDLHGIVVESTYNWYWLVDGLQEHGYHVHLANLSAINSTKA